MKNLSISNGIYFNNSYMKFYYPRFPAAFELPDDWWIDAGMMNFTPIGLAFKSTSAVTDIIKLRDVEPPFRNPEYPLDWNGFSRERMISVLSGIARGAALPPVPVRELTNSDFPPIPFQYRICDGYHRYYAAVAAGFECLPILI